MRPATALKLRLVEGDIPMMGEPRGANEQLDPGTDAVESRVPLPRLTTRVFTDLAIWMTGLGLAMGLVFPFFAVALGVPSKYVLTAPFFVATISAGLVVGWANQFLSHLVVRERLRFMGSRMAKVEQTLRLGMLAGDVATCTPETCSLPVDSDDELGAAAASFNRLVDALAVSHTTSHMAREFTATHSSDTEFVGVVNTALKGLRDSGRYEAAAVCVLEHDDFITAASVGVENPGGLPGAGLVRRALHEPRSVRADGAERAEVSSAALGFRPRSIVAHALHVGDVPAGVVLLATSETASESDVLLMEQLAPSFAVALNNALSHERLQKLAAIDSLTGLLNRRHGLERLDQEFSRATRSGEPLSVLMFDIDHFKSVNDDHGHQVGDEVLRDVAGEVSEVLRDGDVLMRYGGEEFLAVLPGASEDDVLGLGERIRAAIESSATAHGSSTVRVTVSLGGASFPSRDVIDPASLIRCADEAMYVAKRTGRNRLQFADGEAAMGA